MKHSENYGRCARCGNPVRYCTCRPGIDYKNIITRPMTLKCIKAFGIILLFMTYMEVNAQWTPCKQESYDKIKEADTLKEEVIRCPREGSVCFTYTHYQIPLTPFYVLQPNRWFRHRHAPIIKLGWWYVPFISKRKRGVGP